MPKTLARSVIARAGMPSAAARSTASSMRTIPSVIEYSLWSRRWTKAGFGICTPRKVQLRDVQILPQLLQCERRSLTRIKTLFGLQDQAGHPPGPEDLMTPIKGLVAVAPTLPADLRRGGQPAGASARRGRVFFSTTC